MSNSHLSTSHAHNGSSSSPPPSYNTLPPTVFQCNTESEESQPLFILRSPSAPSLQQGSHCDTIDNNPSSTASPPTCPNFQGFLDQVEDDYLKNISVGGIIAYINDCQKATKHQANHQQHHSNDADHVKRQSMFFSAVVPSISNEDYIKRIGRFLSVPSYVYVTAFIYLEKLANDPYFIHLKLSPENTHRLLITAVYAAARILTPTLEQVNPSHFSRVGGTRSVDEMKRLELTFNVFMGQVNPNIEKDGNITIKTHGYEVDKSEFTKMIMKLASLSEMATKEAAAAAQSRQDAPSTISRVSDDASDSTGGGGTRRSDDDNSQGRNNNTSRSRTRTHWFASRRTDVVQQKVVGKHDVAAN